MNTTIRFKVNKDDRAFRAGQEFILDHILEGRPNYIVGPNGSGKSTLLRVLRAAKDTIYENLPQGRKEWTIREGVDNYMGSKRYDVDTGDWDYIFYMDAENDNPLHYTKCVDASAMVDNGGLGASRISHGEKSRYMMYRGLDEILKFFGKSIKDQASGPLATGNILLVVDEMDEGLDLKNQMTYHHILKNICNKHNLTILTVCHNPLVLLSSVDHNMGAEMVYRMPMGEYVGIHEYIKDQTGGFDIYLG